jgi:hypothetical protein
MRRKEEDGCVEGKKSSCSESANRSSISGTCSLLVRKHAKDVEMSPGLAPGVIDIVAMVKKKTSSREISRDATVYGVRYSPE